MPGETIADALGAAADLNRRSIGAVFTHLGENIADAAEAASVTRHYLEVLDRIRETKTRAEISVKLTQLGLDLGPELCYANLESIVRHAGGDGVVWIDMEASPYVDRTLDLCRRVHKLYPNVGVCLQAYLRRTAEDLAALVPLGVAIRLVKGAYSELSRVAFPRKRDVDENYFALARELLSAKAREAGVRAALATHDRRLVRRIIDYTGSNGIGPAAFEFQMLYGIQREEQSRLARLGWKLNVLISYGQYWFPWYMRRLAERPANAWFVVRNLF